MPLEQYRTITDIAASMGRERMFTKLHELVLRKALQLLRTEEKPIQEWIDMPKDVVKIDLIFDFIGCCLKTTLHTQGCAYVSHTRHFNSADEDRVLIMLAISSIVVNRYMPTNKIEFNTNAEDIYNMINMEAQNLKEKHLVDQNNLH